MEPTVPPSAREPRIAPVDNSAPEESAGISADPSASVRWVSFAREAHALPGASPTVIVPPTRVVSMESAPIRVRTRRLADGMLFALCPSTGCSATARMDMKASPARSACSSSAVWTPIATAISAAIKESAAILAWSMELVERMLSVELSVARPNVHVRRTSLAIRLVSADRWKVDALANPAVRTPSVLKCPEAMNALAWTAALEMPTRDAFAADL